MICYRCEESARGICRFCGRGVCQDHHLKMPYILTLYIGEEQIPKAIVVADALFCGQCKPQPEPIEMPELY